MTQPTQAEATLNSTRHWTNVWLRKWDALRCKTITRSLNWAKAATAAATAAAAVTFAAAADIVVVAVAAAAPNNSGRVRKTHNTST